MSPASNSSPPPSESVSASAAEKLEDAAFGTEKQVGFDEKEGDNKPTSLAVDGGEENRKERVIAAVVEKEDDVPNGTTEIIGGRDNGAGGLASVATEGDDKAPAGKKEDSDDVVEDVDKDVDKDDEATGLLPEASSVNAVSGVEEEKRRLQLLEQRRQPAGNVSDDDHPRRRNADDDDDDAETAAEPAAADDDDSSRPIKRARTAYFIFAEDRRARVTEDLKNSSGSGNSGGGVTAVARVLGQMWKQLSDEERAPYHAKAAEERERVQAQVLERQQLQTKKKGGSAAYAGSKRGGTVATAADDDSPSSPSPGSVADSDLALPLAKVRKICKLDPDVRGLSREALACITKVSELVLAKLGAEAVKVAALQNRRKLLPDDVAVVCQNREQFAFLREDIVDLVRLQHKNKVAAAHDKSSKKGSTEAAGAANTFVRATSSSSTTLMGAEEDEDGHGGDVNKREGVALAATEEGNNDENIDKTKKKRTKPPKPVPPPLPPASTKPLTSYFAPAGTSASTKSVALTSPSLSPAGAFPES